MRYNVEITKNTPGFEKGTVKSLPLDLALNLEKKGIGKIVTEKKKSVKKEQLNEE